MKEKPVEIFDGYKSPTPTQQQYVVTAEEVFVPGKLAMRENSMDDLGLTANLQPNEPTQSQMMNVESAASGSGQNENTRRV